MTKNWDWSYIQRAYNEKEYIKFLQNEIFNMEYCIENNISLAGVDLSLLPNRLRSYKKELNSILNKNK
jgi:hypothetical protein